uniref:Uncharacterized protein n=1 Tax=Rhodnius prolixus TaxID=13249 RepID=T1HSZ3_RHOPR
MTSIVILKFGPLIGLTKVYYILPGKCPLRALLAEVWSEGNYGRSYETLAKYEFGCLKKEGPILTRRSASILDIEGSRLAEKKETMERRWCYCWRFKHQGHAGRPRAHSSSGVPLANVGKPQLITALPCSVASPLLLHFDEEIIKYQQFGSSNVENNYELVYMEECK